MKPELPQPFNQEDIRKDPKAVVIGLLIGLLLIFGGVIGYLYTRLEKKEERISALYDNMLLYRTQKIDFYEKMIFYKKESETLKKNDTLLKAQTQPYVEKLLK